jgi:hypothetical protein
MVRDFRVLVVGAGFSKPAGLPLGNELFREVRLRARNRFGRDNWLERDLAEYVEYRQSVDGVAVTPETVDYEDFMSFLDVEHFLGLRGGDTWSSEGNEGQLLVKGLIGKIIHERTMHALADLPRCYLQFAESLAPSDIVVTFNYDVLIERSLERVGKPYRLFPHRFSEIGRYSNTIDSSRQEVIVLKMHGSVDWFSRESYEFSEQSYREQGFKATPHDPVFADPEKFRPRPLLEGPQSPEEPLLKVYRIDADRFYSAPHPASAPVILSPSRMKIVYSDRVKNFWFGFRDAGAMSLSVGIIGFSLSGHDEYVKHSIYRLVDNFLNANQDLEFEGRRKTKLKVIDYRPDEESRREFLDRYRFVDWTRTDLFLEGFGESAVEMLFAR